MLDSLLLILLVVSCTMMNALGWLVSYFQFVLFPPHAPRSIYPDEFENFVERMRVQSANKSRNFPFDVDVIDPMLDVVLDTELGADLSRDA